VSVFTFSMEAMPFRSTEHVDRRFEKTSGCGCYLARFSSCCGIRIESGRIFFSFVEFGSVGQCLACLAYPSTCSDLYWRCFVEHSLATQLTFSYFPVFPVLARRRRRRPQTLEAKHRASVTSCLPQGPNTFSGFIDSKFRWLLGASAKNLAKIL